jgi:hypothetical protein
MYIGPPRNEEERDQRNPKVRWRGKLYRIHKTLGDGSMVRLISMDGEFTIDAAESEAERNPPADTPQRAWKRAAAVEEDDDQRA